MSGQQRPPRATHLLDVLEEVPLSDFDVSTWTPLARSDHRSFKLICRQSSNLADQLIASTHRNLHQPPPRSPSASGDDGAALRDETLLRPALAAHAAFLTRLPRLTSLTLSRWPSEPLLTRELLACGAATQGRVTKLALAGADLSVDGMRAVQLAFPQLRDLSVSAPSTSTGGYVELRLSGQVFLPLHGAPWLTKLSVSTEMHVSEESLRSLAGLATLQNLELCLYGELVPQCLRLLTGLLGLESCHVDVSDFCRCTLPDFAALLAATRLKRLQLTGDWEDHLERADAYPAAEHAAALALLSGLSRLHTLHFGPDFIVDNPTYAAIRCLAHLTVLGVGEVLPLPAATPPAHFHLLQQLHLGWGEPAFPLRVLRSVLHLLPLPALKSLNGDPQLVVDVSGEDDDDEVAAAEWAATLEAVLQGLAPTPMLGPQGGGVCFTNSIGNADRRTLAQLAGRLRPTAPVLIHCVQLHELALEGAPWGVLHACWPGLFELVLLDCNVSTLSLAALVGGMVTLQRLEMRGCRGLKEGGGWAVVAAHCCRPLQVKVGPRRVPEEVRVRCGAVQQVLYGVHNIEWLD